MLSTPRRWILRWKGRREGLQPHRSELLDEVGRRRGHGGELGKGRAHIEKSNEVLHLDLYPVLDVGILGEVVRDRLQTSAVAAVDGPDGVEGGRRHVSVVIPRLSVPQELCSRGISRRPVQVRESSLQLKFLASCT